MEQETPNKDPESPTQQLIPSTQITQSQGKKKYVLAIILLIIFSGILGLVVYITRSNKQKSAIITPNQNPKNIKPKFDDNKMYDISLQLNPKSTCKSLMNSQCLVDVYLLDPDTQKKEFFKTVDNMQNDSRTPEFAHKNVFLIRRVGNPNYPSKNWTDELWKYSLDGKEQKVFSYKGLSFRAHPSQSIVAIEYSPKDDLESKVVLINDMTLADYTDEIALAAKAQGFAGDKDIELADWDSTGEFLWVLIRRGPTELAYVQLNPVKDEVVVHSLPPQVVEVISFNPNIATVLFNDKPFQFDVDSDEQWNRTHPNISYSLYHLSTKSFRLVEKVPSDSKISDFKWTNENILEYTKSGEKMVFVVK